MQELQIGRGLIVSVACNFGVVFLEQQMAALFCETSF
jgi:hypothetical protein